MFIKFSPSGLASDRYYLWNAHQDFFSLMSEFVGFFQGNTWH